MWKSSIVWKLGFPKRSDRDIEDRAFALAAEQFKMHEETLRNYVVLAPSDIGEGCRPSPSCDFGPARCSKDPAIPGGIEKSFIAVLINATHGLRDGSSFGHQQEMVVSETTTSESEIVHALRNIYTDRAGCAAANGSTRSRSAA